MKIKELASELSLTGKEVLEKAKTMGIEVSGINDELSDIDTTAVRNTIMKSGTHAETKVVRVRTKKSDSEKKDGEPKVTVKAAKIKLPEVKKVSKDHCKVLRKDSCRKTAGRKADRFQRGRRQDEAACRETGSKGSGRGKTRKRKKKSRLRNLFRKKRSRR